MHISGLNKWQYPIGAHIMAAGKGKPYETPVPPADDPGKARLVEEMILRVKARLARERQ